MANNFVVYRTIWTALSDDLKARTPPAAPTDDSHKSTIWRLHKAVSHYYASVKGGTGNSGGKTTEQWLNDPEGINALLRSVGGADFKALGHCRHTDSASETDDKELFALMKVFRDVHALEALSPYDVPPTSLSGW